MKLVRFGFYYLGLITATALGAHATVHPLDPKWRWRYWCNREQARRRWGHA
ncbi:MAG: hypothetical protein JO053_07245 [Acidobacteria bacterium]|nr:hypothetical protein [Acidobacteriota bacterium]